MLFFLACLNEPGVETVMVECITFLKIGIKFIFLKNSKNVHSSQFNIKVLNL